MWDQIQKIAEDQLKQKFAQVDTIHLDEGPEGWKAGSNDVTRVDRGFINPKILRRKGFVDIVRSENDMVHTKATFNALKNKIKEEGWDPQYKVTVAVNRDGSVEIIDGTHRLFIAELLGIEKVPVEIRYFGNSQRDSKNIIANNIWNKLQKVAQEESSNPKYYHTERTVGDVKEEPDLGIYLADSYEAANRFSGGKSQIHEADTDFKKPLVISPVSDDSAYRDWFSTKDVNEALRKAGVAYESNGDDDDEFYRFVDWGGMNLIKAIKKSGYDALIYPERSANSVLVFNKKLVKLK